MVFCPYFVQRYLCEDSTSHLTNVRTVRWRLSPLGNMRFEFRKSGYARVLWRRVKHLIFRDPVLVNSYRFRLHVVSLKKSDQKFRWQWSFLYNNAFIRTVETIISCKGEDWRTWKFSEATLIGVRKQTLRQKLTPHREILWAFSSKVEAIQWSVIRRRLLYSKQWS